MDLWIEFSRNLRLPVFYDGNSAKGTDRFLLNPCSSGNDKANFLNEQKKYRENALLLFVRGRLFLWREDVLWLINLQHLGS